MESWKQGRGELFKQLENVYSTLGENIAAELNNDKFARISTEELRILQETSASVQKLADAHGRLTDELEASREAVAKVEELEKENKRLAHELQTKLSQDSTPLANPASRIQHGNHRDLTPGSSEPPSSVARIEPGETKQTTQKKYDELAKKYDKVCQKLEAMKGAKEFASGLVKEERAKVQDWKDWGDNMNEQVSKKDEKIRKLKEQIKDLKSKLEGQSDKSEEESTSGQQTEPVTKARTLLPPIPDATDVEVQVPVISPLKRPQHEIAAGNPNERVNDGHRHPAELEMDLPPLPDEETYIGDTGFEPLEAHHTSSTEGDPDTILPEMTGGGESMADPLPENDESNLPVFVSARSVEKRKTRNQNADETPGPQIKVEVIEISSPHTPVAAYINASESMDLDDIGEKVSTPRKAHREAVISQHISRLVATSQSRSRSQSQTHSNTSATSAPVSHVTPDRPALQPRSVNTKILPRTSEDTGRVKKKRKIASDQAVAELTEDGEITPVNRGLKRHTSDNERLIDLLSKPSPDRRVLRPSQSRPTVRPLTSILAPIQRPTSRITSASTVAFAHELLGITPPYELEPPKPTTNKPKPSREPTPISRPSSTRNSRGPVDLTPLPSKQPIPTTLEASRPLSGQVPRSSAESFRPSSILSSISSKAPSIPDEGIVGRSSSPFSGTQLPARRDLTSAFVSRTTLELAKASPRTPTIGRPGRPSRPVTAKKKHIQTETDYEMDPDQEPLRARPVDKLGLHDFKINPTYNQGYDFAYNEVVRGKEARASLQGCIKSDCCGPQFRGLAKAELDIRHPTLSQEERDETLLEEYLGTGAADRIKAMNTDEREETLIQAKTRELANKFGRHRHAYGKESDPTGFWRADFPTTQEEVEEREAEKEQVRELVQQRWREAMRPGGAYLFRDE